MNQRLVPSEVIGTILVGAAQPFFQCSPPLLSATWFASSERALATATALNFNQVPMPPATSVFDRVFHRQTISTPHLVIHVL